jgi:hypothetical protein
LTKLIPVGFGQQQGIQKDMGDLVKQQLTDLVMSITKDQYRNTGKLIIFARSPVVSILII